MHSKTCRKISEQLDAVRILQKGSLSNKTKKVIVYFPKRPVTLFRLTLPTCFIP